jgi:hypothetical protein
VRRKFIGWPLGGFVVGHALVQSGQKYLHLQVFESIDSRRRMRRVIQRRRIDILAVEGRCPSGVRLQASAQRK